MDPVGLMPGNMDMFNEHKGTAGIYLLRDPKALTKVMLEDICTIVVKWKTCVASCAIASRHTKFAHQWLHFHNTTKQCCFHRPSPLPQ